MKYKHPHMKVARMEAAVEVLGFEIARLSARIHEEERKTEPDQRLIKNLWAQKDALRDRQDMLHPDDEDEVARILEEKIN